MTPATNPYYKAEQYDQTQNEIPIVQATVVQSSVPVPNSNGQTSNSQNVPYPLNLIPGMNTQANNGQAGKIMNLINSIPGLNAQTNNGQAAYQMNATSGMNAQTINSQSGPNPMPLLPGINATANNGYQEADYSTSSDPRVLETGQVLGR